MLFFPLAWLSAELTRPASTTPVNPNPRLPTSVSNRGFGFSLYLGEQSLDTLILRALHRGAWLLVAQLLLVHADAFALLV